MINNFSSVDTYVPINIEHTEQNIEFFILWKEKNMVNKGLILFVGNRTKTLI